MTNGRTTVPDRGETRALLDAMDEQAEAFLTSCVTFAKFMQTDVEFEMAHDLLKAMTAEIYRRKEFYEKRVDPISGKLAIQTEVPPPPVNVDWDEVFRRASQ